ncbi:zinc-binding dehydrogenase [Mycolicibacterium fortuitum]|nr:zinc-binding dehydrogenase [Mycolicibacterium fortuitum]
MQIAKAYGAYVIGLASAGAVDFVASLGADEVIDYTTTDFAEVVSDLDVVFDLIGRDYPAKALQVLRPGGSLVSSLPQSLPAVAADAAARGIRLAELLVEADRLGMTVLAELAGRGALTPTIAGPSRWSRREKHRLTGCPRQGGADPVTSTAMGADLLVIGFGKGGKTLAADVGRAGQRVILVEQDAQMFGAPASIPVACRRSRWSTRGRRT